uniref:RNA polymerase N 8 kDa subunit n=1 Tax=Pithovirus LCPAC403 TaxID=2506596 RepID=A0A481ZBV1_9VIRU|nr:MAG: RNA polymerase N 8 kDa subunit [Pithovirus LCPAC403]
MRQRKSFIDEDEINKRRREKAKKEEKFKKEEEKRRIEKARKDEFKLELIETQPVPKEEMRWITPIRCRSCGKLLSHKSELYHDLIFGGLTSFDAFDKIMGSYSVDLNVKDNIRTKYLYETMISGKLSPLEIIEILDLKEVFIDQIYEELTLEDIDISEEKGDKFFESIERVIKSFPSLDIDYKDKDNLYNLYLMMINGETSLDIDRNILTFLKLVFIDQIDEGSFFEYINIGDQKRTMLKIIQNKDTSFESFKRVMESYSGGLIQAHRHTKYLYHLYLMMIKRELSLDMVEEILNLTYIQISQVTDEDSLTKLDLTDEKKVLLDIIKKHQRIVTLNNKDILTLLRFPEASVDIYGREDFYKSTLGDYDYNLFSQMTTNGLHPLEIYTDNTILQLEEIRASKRRTIVQTKPNKGDNPTIKEIFEILNLNDYEKYMDLVVDENTPQQAFNKLGYSGEKYLSFISDVKRTRTDAEALNALGYYGHIYNVFCSFKKGYVSGKRAFHAMGSNRFEMYLSLRDPKGISKERAFNMLGFFRACCRINLEHPYALPRGRLYKDNTRSKIPDEILYPHESLASLEFRTENVRKSRTTVIDNIGLSRQLIIEKILPEEERIIHAKKETYLTVERNKDEQYNIVQEFENDDISDDTASSISEEDEIEDDEEEDDEDMWD